MSASCRQRERTSGLWWEESVRFVVRRASVSVSEGVGEGGREHVSM